MNIVHSFWSKPLFFNKFSKFDELLPVILTDYAYSAACVKHHGHNITLYADEKGAELLSFIPYDKVVILTDLDDESEHFAAQIKFSALSNMSDDEVLIDGDLFLRKPQVFDYISDLKADFIYSFKEPNSFILGKDHDVRRYQYMRDILLRHAESFIDPYTVDELSSYQWPNTSLMLFHNKELKERYINQYYYHKQLLEKECFHDAWPDIIIEQYHMEQLLRCGYTSAAIIDNYPSTDANDKALTLGFTHLGGSKIFFNQQVSELLKELDPDLFQQCQYRINLFK